VTTPATQPAFVATPVPHTVEELGAITYNADGLVGAIVQDASDGTVLMFAWMNSDSLARTLETSGDRQYVRSVHYDCDGDALLVTVDQEGAGACHTGHRSCFYRAFGDGPDPS